MAFFPQYLTVDEESQIHQQFQRDTWRSNNQVLWSGILRNEAQRWADEHGMQTLTTAMGPLMDPSHPLCLKKQKSSEAWSKYIKGASAIFAWHISRGERVTVLSPPPPERFHPSEGTNYQAIEEPIVKGKLGTTAVSRIEMVHPTVKGAENFCYQMWPVDETNTWTAKFGELNVKRRCWRMVRKVETLSNNLGDIGIIIKATKQYGVEYKPIPPYQEEEEEEEEEGKKRIEEEKKKIARKEKKIAKTEMKILKKKEKTAKKREKKKVKGKKRIEEEEKKIAKEKKAVVLSFVAFFFLFLAFFFASLSFSLFSFVKREKKREAEAEEERKVAKEQRKIARRERKVAKKEEKKATKKQKKIARREKKVAKKEKRRREGEVDNRGGREEDSKGENGGEKLGTS